MCWDDICIYYFICKTDTYGFVFIYLLCIPNVHSSITNTSRDTLDTHSQVVYLCIIKTPISRLCMCVITITNLRNQQFCLMWWYTLVIYFLWCTLIRSSKRQVSCLCERLVNENTLRLKHLYLILTTYMEYVSYFRRFAVVTISFIFKYLF